MVIRWDKMCFCKLSLKHKDLRSLTKDSGEEPIVPTAPRERLTNEIRLCYESAVFFRV